MKAKSATRERTALTHRLLETLKPEASAFRIPDARCVGLAVRVAPSGVLSFDLAYRIAKSKRFRRLSLGKFPDVSLEAARSRANDLTRAARAGRDLVCEEEQARAAAAARITVEELANEYIVRRVQGRLRTAHEIQGRLKRALASVLGRPADELRRRDLRRLLDATMDAGHPREAEQRRVCLNGLFKWALQQDHIEINPMAGLTSYGRSPPRQRVLSIQEINVLWQWLAQGEIPPDAADVLRVQLALGARCSEVGGMRAEEFDRESWLWTLPPERSKNGKARVTPIVGLAREVISRRIRDFEHGPLFTTDSGRPLTAMHLVHFLMSHRPPIAKFGTHDLRRTVVSIMAEGLGLHLELIARVIGHTGGDASTRVLIAHYVRADFVDQKTNALLAWDDRLRAIIAGDYSLGVNIVALADARRALG
ncbi:MAG TPA: integrase family protein [Xanthobacteraceae bacterium]|jgi:integrase|nr:integrase family protein [Xanthobacteraceae bacterium]